MIAPRRPVIGLLLLGMMAASCGAPSPASSPPASQPALTPSAAVASSLPVVTAPACGAPGSIGCFAQAVAAAADDGRFRGVVLIARAGQPIWHEAYGEDLTVDTRLGVASAGKMFTAVAVGQLAADGLLSFDDPIDTFVMDLPSDVGTSTISALLSHTSGLGMMQVGTRLQYPPGEFHYSNAGFGLLSKAVQSVTDDTFAHYLNENVFDPTGMLATHIPEGDTASGAGGEASTAADMLRFMNALAAYELLDESMTTLMTSPQSPFADGDSYGYGFGIFDPISEGVPPWIGHIGLAPDDFSLIETNRALDRTIIILGSRGYEDITSARDEYISALGSTPAD